EEYVVGSEKHTLAKFRLDAVSLSFLSEEAGKPRWRDVVGDSFVIVALATPGNRVLSDVGGEHLYLRPRPSALLFQQQHRQAVRLFACGAADRPYTNLI